MAMQQRSRRTQLHRVRPYCPKLRCNARGKTNIPHFSSECATSVVDALIICHSTMYGTICNQKRRRNIIGGVGCGYHIAGQELCLRLRTGVARCCTDTVFAVGIPLVSVAMTCLARKPEFLTRMLVVGVLDLHLVGHCCVSLIGVVM